MSVEIIGLIVAVGTWLVTMVGGFLTFGAWLLRRMDERFERADTRSERRFAVVDARFSTIDGRFSEIHGRFSEIDGRFSELDERLHRVEKEQLKSSEKLVAFDARFDRIEENIGVLVKDVNDVKIAVARLEGPQPRLIVPGA